MPLKQHTDSHHPRRPVIVLSGFQGGGKPTLLNEVLHDREERRVAVIVNDMSEVDIHTALVERGGAQQPSEWPPRHGDRHQALVFIGQQMDEAAVRARLDACLIGKGLASRDSQDWMELPNPFPELQMVEAAA